VTENGEIAKTIGNALGVHLKAAGFRKRANSFNRSAKDGLVHHVSIQLGAYDPSGIHAVPGLLPDLYGRFRVNLGVYVPAMNRMGSPRSNWINDYNCKLRWGLGDFMPGGFDQWWDLRDRLALEEVTEVLFKRGLPHLDGFRDSESVLAAYAADGARAFGPIASVAVALDIADLLLSRGEREEAETLLTTYVSDVAAGDHRGHKEYLRGYLTQRGFERLGDRLG
jgi:Domain of unknown function (DUF4304)